MMKISNKITSLYIHIPFCEKICNYCDFPKLQYFRLFAEKYLIFLEKEINSLQVNKNLKTIYVGGGTPTILDDDLFEKLLKIILPYTSNIEEYTFEANPESLSINKLKLMKSYGVNRLSIGVESTNDRILRSLNRQHTFADVKMAVSNAKEVGFDNLNVDLIIGLPNVLKSQLKKDIDNLLSLDIQHLSAYSLTVHPNTIFGIKGISEPNSDDVREFYDLVVQEMEKHQFIHYEVSNFAKQGFQSRHNLTYWRNEQYYGVGLGAAGYIDNIRYSNTKSITDYLNGITIKEKEILTLNDQRDYAIMLNLRTNEGIDLNQFKQLYGEELLTKCHNQIQKLISRNLLKLTNNHLVCTYEGLMILDQIILDLI